MGDPHGSRGGVRSTGKQRKMGEKHEAAQRNCCADDPNLAGCLGRNGAQPAGKTWGGDTRKREERCWTL